MEPQPSDLVVFEHDKDLVLEAFHNGEFDAVEVVSEVAERHFFDFLKTQNLLQELAAIYPTPRVKQEIAVWFYLAADLALRLHGRHSYERETPCGADFLRKLAKDTDASALQSWLGQALPRALKSRRAFDREGIFIGDGSYLFVPDNHPVSYKNTPPEKRSGLRPRRCYKMVTLLHTNRAREFFFYFGVRVVPGAAHESPVVYELVEQFIEAVGSGVMKLLILDRGFLDGKAIGQCRRKHRIDVLIPLKKNMDLFVDAMGLAQDPQAQWQELPQPPSTPAQARPGPLAGG